MKENWGKLRQIYESLISHDYDNDMIILYDHDLSLLSSYFCGFVNHNRRQNPLLIAEWNVLIPFTFIIIYVYFINVTFNLCFSFCFGQLNGQMVSKKKKISY